MTDIRTTGSGQRTEPKRPSQKYYGSALQVAFAVAQLVPPLALKLAYRLFYVPRKSKRPPFAPEGFEKRSVRVGDNDIRVYTVGEGPPVLLIHGWELGVYRFEALMREVAKAGFRVVAFDIPGHGESTGRHCDIIEISKVAAELDTCFGPFVGGIAHSYGGLCLANLLRMGLKLRKVVLLATPATYEGIIARFGEFLHLRPGVMASLREAVDRRYAPHRLEEDFSAVKSLRKTKTPALVVHDEADPVVPFADAAELAGAHEGVRVLGTKGLGHNRIVASPEVLASCVEFLASERKGTEAAAGRAH